MNPKATDPQVHLFLGNVMFLFLFSNLKQSKWQHRFGPLLMDNHLLQNWNANDDTFHNHEEGNNKIISHSLTTMAKNLKITIETIQVVEWMESPFGWQENEENLRCMCLKHKEALHNFPVLLKVSNKRPLRSSSPTHPHTSWLTLLYLKDRCLRYFAILMTPTQFNYMHVLFGYYS